MSEEKLLLTLKYSLKGTKNIDSLFLNLNLPYGYQFKGAETHNHIQKFRYDEDNTFLELPNPVQDISLEVELSRTTPKI